jgi:hypothetical protein
MQTTQKVSRSTPLLLAVVEGVAVLQLLAPQGSYFAGVAEAMPQTGRTWRAQVSQLAVAVAAPKIVPVALQHRTEAAEQRMRALEHPKKANVAGSP